MDEQTLQLEGLDNLIFGFHAQQAVEKLLKALLAQMGQLYPRTHDIEILETNLRSCGEVLPPTPLILVDLTDYAVEYRYSNPVLPVSLDRDRVIETVRIVREFVQRRVQELDSLSSSPQP